jgi:hypothetical protein
MSRRVDELRQLRPDPLRQGRRISAGPVFHWSCHAGSVWRLMTIRRFRRSSKRSVPPDGVWIAAAMAATSGDVVHLLRDCPQCEQRFQPLHLPFRKAPASSRRPSRLIRAPSSEPRRRLRRPFLARRAGSVRAETAVSTVRMQPRGRQRFGALYRGFRARLARGLRELGCSRRSKARSWSANRWNPANVG